MNLHPSQSLTLAIQNGVSPFTATLDSPLITSAVSQNARTIALTAGTQTGRATLTVTDASGAAIQVPVRVAYDAAQVPAGMTLRVTGNPVDTPWLTLLVQKMLARQVQVQPGVSAQFGLFTLPSELGPGASAAVPVAVHAAGGESYFDVDAVTTVTIQNVAADPFAPLLLMYDDDPEKLAADGVSYSGRVVRGTPARLYYYHQNSQDQRQLAVVLTSSTPATVQLIDASAGPNPDVMSVGHAVTRDFLLQKPRNEGIVVDVGPSAPYVAQRFVMNPLDGAAGSIGIRVMSGDAVTVSVVALPATATDRQLIAYLSQPRLPGDGHHRTGLFSLVNFAGDTLPYTAPGPDASVQYGAQTPPAVTDADDPAPSGRDYGEYGVLRWVNFVIDNPLDRPQVLYLYERPMGGPVRSSFLVNQTLVQVGCARLAERYQVGDAFTVAAHAKVLLPVLTMTDGGSNYPLELGITAAAPQPTVPPISAPDGCFPKPEPTPTTSR